ncbi:hypothetical protein T10_2835 [Trichinella papuae]|uniref:Uncharacterized protein n=1 Tax=Trichinella papuae TaxID=268474 RepID=A0A0V1MDY5_9BILA|nr:hypothetical protein T10_2835 [Trichinella papuae]
MLSFSSLFIICHRFTCSVYEARCLRRQASQPVSQTDRQTCHAQLRLLNFVYWPVSRQANRFFKTATRRLAHHASVVPVGKLKGNASHSKRPTTSQSIGAL